MDSRQDLVRNAVLFLNDPKVQSSPLTQRIEFLQGKGLSESEIQQALNEAASGGPSQGASASFAAAPPAYARQTSPYGFGTVVAAPPVPPKRDWRDIFIMAVVSGGVVYGLTALARKYLAPHLKPPSSTAFQETSASLASQYDAAQSALDEIKEQTAALAAASEKERERVSSALDDVEAAARTVRDAEARWRDDMREVRGEVESVRELVPRMIEKQAAAQNAALTELQSELRSLKTLLVARQGGGAPGPGTGTESGAASPAPTPGSSATTQAANALLQPRGKASIPAWQLPNGGSGASAASASTSGAASPTRE